MNEKHMRFGDYIRKKRQDDPRGLKLADVSKRLGMSLSFLSDIENKRRKPFDAAKIELFADYLGLSADERAWIYDIAARENGKIPADIEDIMMYESIGEMARFALRQSKVGNATEEDWKRFILEIEANAQRQTN